MFCSACTMLCFCLSYSMDLLSRVKSMHHTQNQSSGCRKKAVRTISFQPRMSPSLPIFKDLKLLKLSDIFELRLLTFVFESVNKTSPDCFHNFFLFCSSVHQYSTRQASRGDLYLTQQNSLQYGLRSLRYLGAKLWNTLSAEL